MPLEGENKKEVDNVIATIFDKAEIPIQESSASDGTNSAGDTSSQPGVYTKVWQAVGCDKCNKTGYKGRLGIYEGIMVGDPVMEKIVSVSSSDREIAAAAVPQGILTMLQDGIIKVVQGVTSIEELRRVIDVDSTI